tara:strand:- start:1452 stop:2303 length:852 start_codon:yes stop_codon:yes gene_type:complete
VKVRRGPLLMLAATAAFTAMVGAVKVARAELGPLEVIVWRSAVSAPIAFFLAARTGLALHNRRLLAARVFVGFLAMLGFFTAAKGLALADLTIIGRTQPILVALLAPVFLGATERSTSTLWLLLLAGMVGSALIVGPQLQVGSTYGLWALGAATASALAHIAVRRLGATENPDAIVFALQAGTGLIATVGVLLIQGHLPGFPPTHLVLPLLLVGGCTMIGQLCITHAYRIEKASTVAAASYAAPLFGVVGDLVVWGALPSPWAMAGGVLIVGAGLALVLRQDT